MLSHMLQRLLRTLCKLVQLIAVTHAFQGKAVINDNEANSTDQNTAIKLKQNVSLPLFMVLVSQPSNLTPETVPRHQFNTTLQRYIDASMVCSVLNSLFLLLYRSRTQTCYSLASVTAGRLFCHPACELRRPVPVHVRSIPTQPRWESRTPGPHGHRGSETQPVGISSR